MIRQLQNPCSPAVRSLLLIDLTMIEVVAHDAVAGRLRLRTLRSLRVAGLADAPGRTISTAGAWLVRPIPISLPPGDAYVALGLQPGPQRTQLLRRCGGDISTLRFWQRGVAPLPPVIYLAPQAAADYAKLEHKHGPSAALLQRFLRHRNRRVVHLPALDAWVDRRLRTVQVVTTIQIGGAERITLDLAAELNRLNTPTLVVALGKPTRQAFPAPENFSDLSQQRDRMGALMQVARQFGADVIHAHLLDAADVQRLTAAGFQVVVTLHNTPNAWPRGMQALGTQDAALLLGCAQAVTREITLPIPKRTLWNGIQPTLEPAKLNWRTTLGIPPSAIVLLALANVRFQKRLDRLPEILLATQALLDTEVHLLLAGQGTEQLPLPPRAHALGLQSDIASVLAASDVLIAASDHEGLSLAQLEALAAGKAVVATEVGGTKEVPGITLVPVDASAAQFAAAIKSALANDRPLFPKSFTRHAMARRAQWLYPRVLARSHPPSGLLLVCNNFSVGGAQSSARRLLTQLAARSIKVRAAVVEEEPRRPTAGRAALLKAGIPVMATPPPSRMDAAAACGLLLEDIDRQPPAVVVFWNLISSYKILLADALLHTPVFDVSPGEMLYASLDRYFTQPRTGLPYLNARDYGTLLTGVIVKYANEATQARHAFDCPVHIIPNGVIIPAAIPHPSRRGPIRFSTSARLNPDKKLEELIEAFRLARPRLPACELHIAGGPDGGNKAYAKQLKHLARGLPIKWHGVVRNIPRFLQQCDIFLMISEPAGCPNASLEAMASGLPIIATDHGGASDQVIDGENGFLTPRHDAPALAEKMCVLAHDPALRMRMGQMSRKFASERFSMDHMVTRYLSVLGL